MSASPETGRAPFAARALRAIRGALYYAVFYLGLALGGLLFIGPALVSQRATRRLTRLWFRTMLAALRVVAGVRVELRGPMPTGRVVVAAKHQSMLDVCILYAHLPEPRFVMKKELTRAPVFGWFALRVGTVAVDRSGGRDVVAAMVEALTAPGAGTGQIAIYPQGTRVPPGEMRPYKAGAHAVYAAAGAPCVPVATNAGFFQPRGVAIRPGVAVVEFLDAIPPGLERGAFMERLEREIEGASDALLAEAAQGGA